MPSVGDYIEEKTMDDRPGAQCKRLKRKDTRHENWVVVHLLLPHVTLF